MMVKKAGDMFYFGWTSDLSYRGDSPDVEGNGESNESETYQETTADIVGGIIGASGWDEGTGLPSQDLYTLRWLMKPLVMKLKMDMDRVDKVKF